MNDEFNSAKGQTDSISNEYGAYALISVYLVSFLYNIFLLCRIRFGDIIITKMTTLPYKASLIYLGVVSAQTCLVAITAQKDRDDKSFAKFAGTMQSIYNIMHSLQLALFITFILTRIHE